MQTVGDAMLAACGQFVYSKPVELKPVAKQWFAGEDKEKITMPAGNTITEIFLEQAAKNPSKIIIADQASGAKSFRDIITACLVLKPFIEKLDGECVGIMLPPSVGADDYISGDTVCGQNARDGQLDAGAKKYCRIAQFGRECRSVLTSEVLVKKLASQGNELSAMKSDLCFWNRWGSRYRNSMKLRAWLGGYLSWAAVIQGKSFANGGYSFYQRLGDSAKGRAAYSQQYTYQFAGCAARNNGA